MSNEPDPPPRRTESRSRVAPESGACSPAARAPDTEDVHRCEIDLQNPRRYPEAGARRWRPWVTELISRIAPRADSLAIRFVSDREMRNLNHTYREKDASTDVLSFPQDGELDAVEAVARRHHLGDIAVSVPTARRQAHELGHSVETEIRTLLLHGVLHCLGHDHETDDGTMERLERSLRPRFVDHA